MSNFPHVIEHTERCLSLIFEISNLTADPTDGLFPDYPPVVNRAAEFTRVLRELSRDAREARTTPEERRLFRMVAIGNVSICGIDSVDSAQEAITQLAGAIVKVAAGMGSLRYAERQAAPNDEETLLSFTESELPGLCESLRFIVVDDVLAVKRSFQREVDKINMNEQMLADPRIMATMARLTEGQRPALDGTVPPSQTRKAKQRRERKKAAEKGAATKAENRAEREEEELRKAEQARIPPQPTPEAVQAYKFLQGEYESELGDNRTKEQKKMTQQEVAELFTKRLGCRISQQTISAHKKSVETWLEQFPLPDMEILWPLTKRGDEIPTDPHEMAKHEGPADRRRYGRDRPPKESYEGEDL